MTKDERRLDLMFSENKRLRAFIDELLRLHPEHAEEFEAVLDDIKQTWDEWDFLF